MFEKLIGKTIKEMEWYGTGDYLFIKDTEDNVSLTLVLGDGTTYFYDKEDQPPSNLEVPFKDRFEWGWITQEELDSHTTEQLAKHNENLRKYIKSFIEQLGAEQVKVLIEEVISETTIDKEKLN